MTLFFTNGLAYQLIKIWSGLSQFEIRTVRISDVDCSWVMRTVPNDIAVLEYRCTLPTATRIDCWKIKVKLLCVVLSWELNKLNGTLVPWKWLNWLGVVRLGLATSFLAIWLWKKQKLWTRGWLIPKWQVKRRSFEKLPKFCLFANNCFVQVETKRATPREARDNPDAGQSVKRVFVGGVSEDIQDEELRAYFQQV
jgi:hypothetical protein